MNAIPYSIQIFNDKITYSDLENGHNEIPNDQIWKYLSATVLINDDVTLERIFDIIKSNENLFNKIFYTYTRGYPLKSYLDEAAKNPDDDYVSHFDYLEVYRFFNLEYSFDDELDTYISIHGVSNSESTTYSIGFSKLNNIKNSLISVNHEIKLYDKVYKNYITLQEFIGAILYEISFFGNPEQRQEQLDELNDISEKIKSGEMKTYPIEDFNDFLNLNDEGNEDDQDI